MKKRPRDPGRNGDEIFLPAENFYLPSAGKVRQVDAAPASNASGSGRVGGYGRQGWKQLARMNEQIFDRIFMDRLLHLLEGKSVCNFEFRGSRSAQGCQMSAAAQPLSHFVRHGSHVGS